ncbi:MAG: alpha/beta hydrolase [Chitinophagaceae bacterium]|nr:alpha/beta hydrolase [Chitinophagaceae bacterium]
MRSLFFIVCCVLTINFVFAQQDFSIGKKYSLHSSVLDEEREFYVYLPPDYHNLKYAPARYPVIYVLDGEEAFHVITGLQQFLSRGPYANTPRSIIVGVINTNRTRDLTPALPAHDTVSGKFFSAGGGNEAFIEFITKELKLHVDSAWRTSGYNVLIGHSFGGLTAANILLHHTSLFNAYLIIDPSLWWGQQLLVQQANSILPVKDFGHSSVFLARANHEADVKDTITDMLHSIEDFAALFTTQHPKGLRSTYRIYENEDHGTVPIPAVYDGLRYLFDAHLIPVKPALADPTIVTQQFEKLSQQSGFRFQPSEEWLDWMGNFSLGNKKKDAAIAFYQMAATLYPKSKNAKAALNKIILQKK